MPNVEGLKREEDKRPKKNWDITLHGVWGPTDRSPLVPEVFTPAGVPACSTPVLKSLAGKAGRARKKLAELGLEQEAEGERAPGLKLECELESTARVQLPVASMLSSPPPACLSPPAAPCRPEHAARHWRGRRATGG